MEKKFVDKPSVNRNPTQIQLKVFIVDYWICLHEKQNVTLGLYVVGQKTF